MKIAILGTRGIPANYGGFETFAEECSTRLAARGHQVTVYGRPHYVPKDLTTFKNVRIVVLPTLQAKYTDTVIHTFLSAVHALFLGFDVILICNAANAVFSWLPRLFGMPVALNVDGIERLRQKWGWVGRSYYRLSERISTWLPNTIVTDARVIERYYRDKYGANSVFIPYGAFTEKPDSLKALEELNLVPQDYFLYVSRFEPENNLHRVVAAFEKVKTAKRLVAVGDAPYSAKYIQKVRQTRDPRILFAGAIYGTGYRELLANAFCYVHATEVGGTHPALVEAMGMGNIIVANETPENMEVLGDAGILYRRNDVHELARCLQTLADFPEDHMRYRNAAFDRARANYSWDDVVDKYERLFAQMLSRGKVGAI